MITRRTIFSLLLGGVLALGLYLWNAQHIDDCTPYFQHAPKAATAMLVELAGHSVAISCEDWLPRQPEWVLLACMFCCGCAVVFLVSALADAIETRRRRRDRQAVRAASP